MRTFRFLTVAVSAALTTVASAQVVAFNDFGSDSNSSQFGYQNDGWEIDGFNNPIEPATVGMQFTSSADGILADVILPVLLISGTDGLSVQLCSDASGSVGAPLESWTMKSSGDLYWSAPSILFGDGSVSLIAGQNYWLTVGAVNGDYVGGWEMNEIGLNGTLGVNNLDGTGWYVYSGYTMSAFEVDVTPAPEPVSMVGFGAVSLCLLRKRRRRA